MRVQRVAVKFASVIPEAAKWSSCNEGKLTCAAALATTAETASPEMLLRYRFDGKPFAMPFALVLRMLSRACL